MARWKLVEETDTTETYQYNPIYLGLSIVLLLVAIIAYFTKTITLQYAVIAYLVVHYSIKLIDRSKIPKKIRNAEKAGLAKTSGSIFSISDPLKIKIDKTT